MATTANAHTFEEAGTFHGNGIIPVTKYRSKNTGLTVFFVDIDSQVINGYFCYGVDQPECTGIETMVWHLDSSGGLLPRQMRGEIIRPSWQHHGAENPLADRDQSSYVCCALGETAFLGTFSCSIYLLQNIEAIFAVHGCQSERNRVQRTCQEMLEQERDKPAKEGGEPGLAESVAEMTLNDDSDKDSDLEADEYCAGEPNLSGREFYFLSEAGEGAMAWEATLQTMFPGVRAFWNRLLCEQKARITAKMRECYENFYRPENLTVIITGKLADRDHILETLHEYEEEYRYAHPEAAPFIPAWNDPLPPRQTAITSEVKFVPRNPNREPLATVCFGWRGCTSFDVETAVALKVFTAHVAVGPLWNEFVAKGLAHRVSWCQLEYAETCTLVTIHGITSDELAETIASGTKNILARLGDPSDDMLNLAELRAMANRVGWHFVRELESDPYLILAAAISKGERYGYQDDSQINKRINPRSVFEGLMEKPMEFWKGLASSYFRPEDTFVTKVSPKSYKRYEDLLAKSPEQPIPASDIEESGEHTFKESSRRASSRPRRKANSVIQEASRTVPERGEEDLDMNNNNAEVGHAPAQGDEGGEDERPEFDCMAMAGGGGRLEELINNNLFPFGDSDDEAKDFEKRLGLTSAFLEQVTESQLKFYPIANYRSDEVEQHPQFSVNDMPFYTFLEDVETSFVYVTFVIDTTHLTDEERKYVAPITAALGAVLCPRPPGLDTDAEIEHPNEFHPPQKISDSQVSLGLNGEMMQNIFVMLIVRPENYDWMVGMFQFLLYELEFTPNFLDFISVEAKKGLAGSYKMQTADCPNYDCFDSTEINLHSLVKQVYKAESNARLFVGRRRLDLVNGYTATFKADPAGCTQATGNVWRKLVDEGRISVQIATNVEKLIATSPDVIGPWKKYFKGIQKPLTFAASQPTVERDIMTSPCGEGISVSVNHARPSCLSMAIPINPNHEDFPKLCLASQIFSMAQKWVWSTLEEEDNAQPVIRMPCSYSSILTLNLESPDIMGSFDAMKKILDPDWPWLNTLLVATKLMVVNDPASMEVGPQGAIQSSLLAHLNCQTMDYRRNLVLQSLQTTPDDLKRIVSEYMVKLCDPEQCWYALMSYGEEEDKLIAKLKERGFNLKKINLNDLCSNL